MGLQVSSGAKGSVSGLSGGAFAVASRVRDGVAIRIKSRFRGISLDSSIDTDRA